MTVRGLSSKPEITEEIGITENKPDHHYRTEIPNIIFEILSGDTLLIYCFLKRVAGDDRTCWMSIKNLAKRIGVGQSTLRSCLNNLSIPGAFCEFPLINIIERYKEDGSRNTNLIEIVNIWRLNGDYFRKGKTPPIKNDSTPPIKSDTTPLSKMTYKEDISQEDLIKGIDNAAMPCKSEFKEKFELLKSSDLEAEDHSLEFLARTYPKKKLLDGLNHLKREIQKGTIIKKSKIAFFRYILGSKVSMITEQASINRLWASNAKQGMPWPSLVIHEKYAECSFCMKEVPFDLPQDQFGEAMANLWEMSRRYA